MIHNLLFAYLAIGATSSAFRFYKDAMLLLGRRRHDPQAQKFMREMEPHLHVIECRGIPRHALMLCILLGTLFISALCAFIWPFFAYCESCRYFAKA